MKTEQRIVSCLCAAALVALTGCGNQMSRDEIMRKIRAKTESINKTGNVESIREMFAPDYIFHSTGKPDVRGLDAYIQYLKKTDPEFRKAFPDFKLTVVDTVISDNKAMVHYDASGTHKGPFANIPPTGKKVNIALIYLYRFKNGKFAEGHEIVSDSMGLLRQLGAIPAPGSK